MKCMIYKAQNSVAVPGRVGVEECSLDLIFLLGAARPFGFLVGEGLFFQ